MIYSQVLNMVDIFFIIHAVGIDVTPYVVLQRSFAVVFFQKVQIIQFMYGTQMFERMDGLSRAPRLLQIGLRLSGLVLQKKHACHGNTRLQPMPTIAFLLHYIIGFMVVDECLFQFTFVLMQVPEMVIAKRYS